MPSIMDFDGFFITQDGHNLWDFIRMKKFPSKHKFYDVLHRGTVSVIMAGTLYLIANVGYSIFYHYKYARPQRLEHVRMVKEEEIAQEQLEKERELIRRQVEAEKMAS